MMSADVLGTFVFPHIRDLSNQQYFEKLGIDSAEPEDLSRAISMVTGLRKKVRNQIFTRNLRDNYVSTLPQELSSRDSMYYSKEQKEKDETLVKLHKDFDPVLQVLLHTAIQTLRSPDDTVSTETLLSECQSSTADLCKILFEIFGEHVMQPRRDIFENHGSIGLSFHQLWLPYET